MDLKFKKLNKKFTEDNYPTLADALNKIKGLSKEQEELVAGLCLEICLLSNGETDIFSEDLFSNLEMF